MIGEMGLCRSGHERSKSSYEMDWKPMGLLLSGNKQSQRAEIDGENQLKNVSLVDGEYRGKR